MTTEQMKELRKKIAPHHWHILDAYLDGAEVYWYDDDKNIRIEKRFIEDYNENWTYEAVPKTLENCYCEASELHYEKLIADGYTYNAEDIGFGEHLKFEIVDNEICYTKLENGRQIQYNQQLNNWVYCPYKEKENMSIADQVYWQNEQKEEKKKKQLKKKVKNILLELQTAWHIGAIDTVEYEKISRKIARLRKKI